MTKLQLNRNISKREHKFTDTVVRFVSYIDFKHLYGTINDNCFMTDNIRVLVSKLIIYSMAFQESWMHYRENRKGTSSIVVTPLCVNKCVNKTCAILQTTTRTSFWTCNYCFLAYYSFHTINDKSSSYCFGTLVAIRNKLIHTDISWNCSYCIWEN